MRVNSLEKKWQNFRQHLFATIFGNDTKAGHVFDIFLLWAIIISVIIVLLDSVSTIKDDFGPWLYGAEWFFTIIFTIEYIMRVISSPRPWRYIFSFFGIVDLLALLPTYLSMMFSGTEYLLVIRSLRLLRAFRVFKLARYLGEAEILRSALIASRPKIIVFLFTVSNIVIIMGALMYLIEGEENGFTSIPRGMYWAIVTLTTVGYGDIAPKTMLGQFVAAIIMIMGYAIIAVPTGIVSVNLAQAQDSSKKNALRNVGPKDNAVHVSCPLCGNQEYDPKAVFCKFCGSSLKKNME